MMEHSSTSAFLLGLSVSLACFPTIGAAQSSDSIGIPKYTVPASFPTSAFSSYYSPATLTAEPQPALYDPVLNITFPLNLTNPSTIPTNDTDPVYYPQAVTNLSAPATSALLQTALTAILGVVQDSSLPSNCSKCLAGLNIAKTLALIVPQSVPNFLVNVCRQTKFASNSTCQENYEATTFGAAWTQILAFADVSGQDGQYICNSLSSTFCPAPTTNYLNVSALFPKPKPANAKAPPPSGKRVKVLHLSDFHLDPRYAPRSEANCTGGLCCRNNVHNAASSQVLLPAPLYGSFLCDTPYYLGLGALQAIGPLTGTGTGNSSFAWSIYTGDLVSHDPQSQLSRAYVEYTELSIYDMFKEYIDGPVFPVLGNHDSNPEALDGPHSLPGPLGQQFSWNYDHVTSLWQQNGWINATIAKQAALHYAGYSVKNQYGLRIITLNTDFWYRSNFYNFINTTNPDVSGMLGFLIQELQAAEDAKERVWILGHVLTGWDGSNPLNNPTDLFYQIVDRYSPHVIANVFFGHTHEDEVMIFYANNGTKMTSQYALTPGWIGPSVTPLTNLNSGFRMYEVDTNSFDVYDAYTWYADVSSFPSLNNTGPTYQFEYSTRETYGPSVSWPSTAPLNATFWHNVTEAMEKNHTLVQVFNTYQGKSSVKSPNCSNEACAAAKVCYMRSGSAPLGRLCPRGYGITLRSRCEQS